MWQCGGYHTCRFRLRNNVVWNCVRNIWRYKKERITFLQRIIVVVKIWVHDFESELKSQERGLEGKKFTVAEKTPSPSFEGETNDDNGLRLYWHNCHILSAIGCTMDQHMYIHFLRKILKHKLWQTHSQMLDHAIIFHDNTCVQIATSVCTVLIWVIGLRPFSKTQETTLGIHDSKASAAQQKPAFKLGTHLSTWCTEACWIWLGTLQFVSLCQK